MRAILAAVEIFLNMFYFNWRYGKQTAKYENMDMREIGY